jgi:organic hydroperoxide reductase OsmC/OhrA
MAQHRARIVWELQGEEFASGRYSRVHRWEFDGGLSIPASPAPSVVPVPYADPANVDPEEAYIAAIASCHMLTFLHLASKGGFVVEAYADDAVGTMGRGANGVPWVATVELNPKLKFGGAHRPSSVELDRLHHAAHEQCFIANSIRTEVVVLRGDSNRDSEV